MNVLQGILEWSQGRPMWQNEIWGAGPALSQPPLITTATAYMTWQFTTSRRLLVYPFNARLYSGVFVRSGKIKYIWNYRFRLSSDS